MSKKELLFFVTSIQIAFYLIWLVPLFQALKGHILRKAGKKTNEGKESFTATLLIFCVMPFIPSWSNTAYWCPWLMVATVPIMFIIVMKIYHGEIAMEKMKAEREWEEMKAKFERTKDKKG